MGLLQDLETSILSADRLQIDGIPSASIAICENGNVSSHVISNGQENADTVYQSCSISKAITALAVAKLVDEGRIRYETKAIDHLSGSTIACLVDEKTAHLMQYVTVGMLLSHTSGISQGGFIGYAGDMPSVEDIFAGRPPANSPKMYFMTFPGAQFSYSGGGFTILQLVLEDVTKTSFAELMQETVLMPLGMTRSWYGALPSGEKNYARAHVTGFTAYPQAAEYHQFVELAAAGLWTTPTDLLKATSAVQDSLHSDSGFLSQSTANKMLTQVGEKPGFGGMSLGWSVTDKTFAHAGGNDPGYNTYVFGFRDRASDDTKGGSGIDNARNGVAIMTNSSMGHEVAIKQITSAIFYLKGWERFTLLPSYFGDDDYVPYAAPATSKIEGDWRAWIGHWDSEWQLVDQDGPGLKFQSMDAMKLRPAAAPVRVFEGGKSEMFFVVDGLKVGLRLTWEKDERVIQLLQVEARTLRKKSGL